MRAPSYQRHVPRAVSYTAALVGCARAADRTAIAEPNLPPAERRLRLLEHLFRRSRICPAPRTHGQFDGQGDAVRSAADLRDRISVGILHTDPGKTERACSVEGPHRLRGADLVSSTARPRVGHRHGCSPSSASSASSQTSAKPSPPILPKGGQTIPSPTAALTYFARLAHATRTIEMTSLAPRTWACCIASSADSTSSTCSAAKVTTKRRSSLLLATPAVRDRRDAVATGVAFATGASALARWTTGGSAARWQTAVHEHWVQP